VAAFRDMLKYVPEMSSRAGEPWETSVYYGRTQTERFLEGLDAAEKRDADAREAKKRGAK